MRLLGVIVGCLLLLPCPTTASADLIADGQDAFVKASESILKWLKQLDGSLGSMVATENRAQLVDRLREMNGHLHEVEMIKELFLDDVKRFGGNPSWAPGIRNTADVLEDRVRALRASVDKVAVLLREEWKTGGADCERLLTQAVGQRRIWLHELADHMEELNNEEFKDRLIVQGEAALRALREASLELAKLTRRLSES
jgi:hypothetical protein